MSVLFAGSRDRHTTGMAPICLDQVIRRLLLWEVHKEFVTLVVLVSFLCVNFRGSFRVLEFFAGIARIAREAAARRIKTARHDIKIGKCMDINSPAGYVSLDHFLRYICAGWVFAFKCVCVCYRVPLHMFAIS